MGKKSTLSKLKHDAKILSKMHFRDLPTEDEWLAISPKLEPYDDSIELYEDGKVMGIYFPNGIDPQILIDKINEIDKETT
ncbi:MAG: hypothetical protein WC846_04595 [Candidatus Gracilibacteria bacterium]|jgi:hypothetical protein